MEQVKGKLVDDLIMKDEVYLIVGAAIEVHKELGCGFLEPIYQEAMQIELSERSIPFEPQKRLLVSYKGNVLNKEYIADIICYEKIIVELKAMDRLTIREEGQIINYLKATHLPLGLLINFGSLRKLEWRRLANTLES